MENDMINIFYAQWGLWSDLAEWPLGFLVVLQHRIYINQRFSALNDAADGGFQGLVFSHKLNKNVALLLSVDEREKYITNALHVRLKVNEVYDTRNFLTKKRCMENFTSLFTMCSWVQQLWSDTCIQHTDTVYNENLRCEKCKDNDMWHLLHTKLVHSTVCNWVLQHSLEQRVHCILIIPTNIVSSEYHYFSFISLAVTGLLYHF